MPWSSNGTFLVELCLDGEHGPRGLQAGPRRARAVGLPAGPLPARGRGLRAVRGPRLGARARDGDPRRPARRGLVPALRPRRLRAALLHAARAGAARPRSQAICVFDLLANNADRKSGHCLLGEDGHIWAIDHGLCFHDEPKLRTVIWDFAGEPMPDELLADVARFAVAPPVASFAGLLDDDELEALLARAAALVRRPVLPAEPARATPTLAARVTDDRIVERRSSSSSATSTSSPATSTGSAPASDWDGLVDLRDAVAGAPSSGASSSGRRRRTPSTASRSRRPAPWAGAVLVPGAGRFALGPLTEVAASTHTWAELADRASRRHRSAARRARAGAAGRGPRAATTASTRACSTCRSRSSRGSRRTRSPTYEADGPHFPDVPAAAGSQRVGAPRPGRAVDDAEAVPRARRAGDRVDDRVERPGRGGGRRAATRAALGRARP